jgi:hypothetical protein
MAYRPVVMKRKLSLSAARPPTSRKAREVGHPELVNSTIQSESRYDRAGEVGHPPTFRARFLRFQFRRAVSIATTTEGRVSLFAVMERIDRQRKIAHEPV